DVPHRRIGLGAVPVALAGLDVHDIADIDLLLLVLGRHHAGARGHHQDLVAAMGVPASRAALAEIHHASIVIRGIPRLDDGLARARHRPGPSFDPIGAFHRKIRDVLERDDLHDLSPSCFPSSDGDYAQMTATAGKRPVSTRRRMPRQSDPPDRLYYSFNLSSASGISRTKSWS